MNNSFLDMNNSFLDNNNLFLDMNNSSSSKSTSSFFCSQFDTRFNDYTIYIGIKV